MVNPTLSRLLSSVREKLSYLLAFNYCVSPVPKRPSAHGQAHCYGYQGHTLIPPGVSQVFVAQPFENSMSLKNQIEVL